MGSSASFWNDRAARYGHTGWANPIISEFDQALRRSAVQRWIADAPGERSAALDYGCGSGDFSSLLSRRYRSVVAVDISPVILETARKKNPAPNIRYQEAGPETFEGKYDLVLCITVLQHILADDELAKVLRLLRGAMRDGGRLVTLDTLGDESNPRFSHLVLRQKEKILEMFGAAGFRLIREEQFFHPTQAPSLAFLGYLLFALPCFVFLRLFGKKALHTTLGRLARPFARGSKLLRSSPVHAFVFDASPL